MKKLIQFLLTVVLSVLIGFWLSEKDVLAGTKAGELLVMITRQIPVPEQWNFSSPVSDQELTTNAFKNKLNGASSSQSAKSDEKADEFNRIIVEDRIFERLNTLRKEKNKPLLQKNDLLKAAADERAAETKEAFSHTRPDGSDAFTVLTEPEHEYAYRLAGENLGMATFLWSEEKMADLIFDGWVDSEGHYDNMVQPDFQEVGIGVYYDGTNLYATQLFGTPF